MDDVGKRKDLAEKIKVSRLTVWKFLTRELNSKKACPIYENALECGGVLCERSEDERKRD